MTYSIIVGKYKLIFSDTHFKDFRKKPTISVYDADTNSETKIASFNSKETFEWFINEIAEQTEPSNRIVEEQPTPIRNFMVNQTEPTTEDCSMVDCGWK